jgi:multidrug efflux pump subunit AcrA (membrane-fusion protein)
MIPDVTQMQVKVGVHESKVDRMRVGMPARVQLQELTLDGEVSEIAEITRPAGWWTGNLVKYDTKIQIKPHEGLKPGMSAIVDIVLAQHDDVLTIPVAAIVEGNDSFQCWIQSPTGPKKRVIRLGDTNDLFSVVLDGLNEGDEVILNPLSNVDEAQAIAVDPSNDNASSPNSKSGSKPNANKPQQQSPSGESTPG